MSAATASKPDTVVCFLYRGANVAEFRVDGATVIVAHRYRSQGRPYRSFDVMERGEAQAHYRALVRSGYRPPEAFTAPQGA